MDHLNTQTHATRLVMISYLKQYVSCVSVRDAEMAGHCDNRPFVVFTLHGWRMQSRITQMYAKSIEHLRTSGYLHRQIVISAAVVTDVVLHDIICHTL